MIPYGDKAEILEEAVQARTRSVMAGLALAVAVGIAAMVSGWTPTALLAVSVLAGYNVLVIACAVTVKRAPGRIAGRRVLMLVSDLGIVTLGMYVLDELGASFYPLYLWIVVANGMRFGTLYLYASTGTAVVGFGVVQLASPFWRDHLTMGLSHWGGLLVLPLFYLGLIRRLHASNEELATELARSEAATGAQATLAAENARLLAESQSTAMTLRETNAELESFVYAVSHDLKAPLVTIDGMAGMLLDEHGAEVGSDGRRYLERIQVNARHMERLVRDLLALSRVGRDARTREPVDLAVVVPEAIEELAEATAAGGIKVTIGDLPTVWAVRIEMEQLFRNLVSNAVKYMGPSPYPAIHVAAVIRGDVVECSVRDGGIGIDRLYHKKIFEPFQRLKEIEAEGTGVGLPIVKKIVEGGGGRIWVESAPGQGATFRFTLPRAPRPDARD